MGVITNIYLLLEIQTAQNLCFAGFFRTGLQFCLPSPLSREFLLLLFSRTVKLVFSERQRKEGEEAVSFSLYLNPKVSR